MAQKRDVGSSETAPDPATDVQRAPAEHKYQRELQMLRDQDHAPKPVDWRLSPRAVRKFVLGDSAEGIAAKFVGHVSVVDRALVSLATNRALLLVGEPGTAKSLLSELLAATISGTSALTIQGSAATGEDQIKYSWNYALLLAEGPSEKSLVRHLCIAVCTKGASYASKKSRVVRSRFKIRCSPRSLIACWRFLNSRNRRMINAAWCTPRLALTLSPRRIPEIWASTR